MIFESFPESSLSLDFGRFLPLFLSVQSLYLTITAYCAVFVFAQEIIKETSEGQKRLRFKIKT